MGFGGKNDDSLFVVNSSLVVLKKEHHLGIALLCYLHCPIKEMGCGEGANMVKYAEEYST